MYQLNIHFAYFMRLFIIYKGYDRQMRRPRCIILVPTRDLARQILGNIKDMSHFSKVSLLDYILN
jgi:superfamily II DNA/RNA helicase